MNRTQKEAFVADFRDKVGQAPVMYLTDFSGLDVKSMTTLRQNLKASTRSKMRHGRGSTSWSGFCYFGPSWPSGMHSNTGSTKIQI